jgi:hypothetical protein
LTDQATLWVDRRSRTGGPVCGRRCAQQIVPTASRQFLENAERLFAGLDDAYIADPRTPILVLSLAASSGITEVEARNSLSYLAKVTPWLLDVDYHHGNGTQTIFYTRADVMTVSVHGDPMTESRSSSVTRMSAARVRAPAVT